MNIINKVVYFECSNSQTLLDLEDISIAIRQGRILKIFRKNMLKPIEFTFLRDVDAQKVFDTIRPGAEDDSDSYSS